MLVEWDSHFTTHPLTPTSETQADFSFSWFRVLTGALKLIEALSQCVYRMLLDVLLSPVMPSTQVIDNRRM